MKMLLVVISLCLGISFGYDLSCPDVSQWSIRARLLCPDPSKYYCLWDGNAKVFKENCSKVDLTRAGERLVIQYNFDSKFCPKDVYQPYPHFTNESSGCIYKKSTCNEEGQVLYDNTDTKHDIKCTCDYTRGYDFITRPTNPCYCIPSEEDCSCYLNPCIMPELEPDSRCTNTTKLPNQTNCAPFKNSSEEDRQDTRPIMRNDEQAMETVSELDRMNVQTVIVFVGCTIAIIGLSLIIVIIVHKFKFREDVVVVDIRNLSFKVAPPRPPQLQIQNSNAVESCNIQDSNIFYVRWEIDTPNSWEVQKLKQMLENFSDILQLSSFKVKCVYIGSLIIVTTVQTHVITDKLSFEEAVRTFLEKFVEVCGIDTHSPATVHVELTFIQDFNDIQEVKTGVATLKMETIPETQRDIQEVKTDVATMKMETIPETQRVLIF